MYDRKKAVQYAKMWALSRNPRYYNYDKIGGDCTNFISQCLYAGGLKMDYSKINGWFYINGNEKSASWTGVDFLRNYLVRKKIVKEFLFEKKELSYNEESFFDYDGRNSIKNIFSNYELSRTNKIEIGDVIQLSKNGMNFTHSLIATEVIGEDIFICCHTKDENGKNLREYEFRKARLLKILSL